MDRYKKIPVGIEYPIGRKTQGYFDTTFDTNANASSCLRLFFSTIKGERRMNPNYGTSLWNFIFENRNDVNDSAIKNIILDEVTAYFPEIVIEEVILNQNIKKDDIYKIEIELRFYSSKSSKELQTIRFSNEI